MDKDYQGNLDHCLKCSTCHTQCPVVANYITFPGPKQLGPELERLRLSKGGEEPLEIDASISYCTNCKRCDISCPHGVKPSFYNMKNKAKLKGSSSKSFRDWILAHNGWWGQVGSRVPLLANMVLDFPLGRGVLGMLGMAKREFPKYSRQKIKISNVKRNKKVLYYTGCYASFNEPEIIQSTVEILEAAGYQVELAPERCCGTPLLSNGFLAEAQKVAEKNTEIFLAYIKKGYKIVTTCPSCGLALKEEYSNLNPGEKNRILKENLWDLFELLNEEGEEPFSPSKEKISKGYYHISCHLNGQGIGAPAGKLLRKYAVEDLVVEDSYCCGIAGTYGFKKEMYPLAMDIGTPLFADIKGHKPLVVITDCGTCKLQIVHGTGAVVKHPAVVLKEYLKR